MAGLIGEDVLRTAPRRAAGSTKFTSGEVLVVGGSRGLTGAVCLAASAAIRAGAGYATVAVPADLEPIFEVKLTEVMSKGFGAAEGRLGAGDADAIAEAAERAAAVVLGPGMGRDGATLALARALGERIDLPAPGRRRRAGRLRGRARRARRPDRPRRFSLPMRASSPAYWAGSPRRYRRTASTRFGRRLR